MAGREGYMKIPYPPKRSFWDRLKDEESYSRSLSDREMEAARERLLPSIKTLFKAARQVHLWFCRRPSGGWFEGREKFKSDSAKKPDDEQ